MKKIIILFFLISSVSLSAQEPSFQISFGSNFKNIPIKFDNMDKNIKTPLGIKINNWVLSPGPSTLINTKKNLNILSNKSSKEILFVRFKYKF